MQHGLSSQTCSESQLCSTPALDPGLRNLSFLIYRMEITIISSLLLELINVKCLELLQA